ncbi:MAG: hypothetical protein H6702_10090 [Myxococcales bacterium]|nr:hypothetical protein [Myxococcales bacterium]
MPATPLLLTALLASPPTLIQAPAHTTWTAGDTVAGAFAAAGGALVGGLAGGYVGLLAGRASCTDADREEFLGCLGPTIGGAMIGGIALSNLGAGLGVGIYGAAQDHDGAFGGALAGSAIGQLGGGLIGLGLCNLDQAALCGLGLGITVASQAIGASIGYSLTVGPGDGPVAHGGLLDYDPAHGLRLSTPGGGLAPTPDGGYQFGLTLAAGEF